MTIERFQFATKADRDAYLADEKLTTWLADRRAYEMANMSPHIRPEHHAQCITQQVVALVGALECDAPTFAPELDKKPDTATRIAVDDIGTKTPIVDDPRDAKIAIEAEAIK